ncbi:MAG: c-type cytochrome [Candidatus Sericytochromatia bacterium]
MRFRLFVVSSILLFITAVLAVWKDFDKDWRKYQAEFNQVEAQKTLDEMDAIKKSIEADPELKKLGSDLKSIEEKLGSPESKGKQTELEAKVKKLKYESYIAERNAKFTKSSIGALDYQIARGSSSGKDIQSVQAEKDKLTAEWEKQLQDSNAVKAELTKAEQELAELSKDYKALKSKYEDKVTKLDTLEKKYSGIKSRGLDIKQVVIPKLNTVDRCMTCHMGIDKDGFEDKKYKKVFQTHPNKDLYLVKHNVKDFGCVSCHQGQGLATTKPEVAHGWVSFWDKPMFQGKQVQASCVKCHKSTDEIPAEFFNKGKELVTSSNCFACHKIEGQEAGLKNGPPLTQAASKLNPSWMVNWVENPRHYLPMSKMPTFKVTNDDAKAITAYVLSKSDANYGAKKGITPNPALADKGEKLFQTKTCNTCHAVKGVGGAVGPDLGRVASKANADWMFNWIKNPRSYHPTTIMPNLNLSDDDALAIVSWLQTKKWDNMPQHQVNLQDAKLVTKGQELIKSLNCAACHNVPDMQGAQNCPELTGLAEKDIHKFDFGYSHLDPKRGVFHTRESYVYNKIRNPWNYEDFVKSRMPRFWFSDEQSSAVYTYIMGITGKHEEMPVKYIYKGKGKVEESNEEIK